jgi:ATP-binding cassette subfamily B protein
LRPYLSEYGCKFYGKHYNADTRRHKAGFSEAGVSLLGMSETAEKIGFRTRGKTYLNQLQEATLPRILHWDQNHFVVLVSISKNKVKIANPARGITSFSIKEFAAHWISSETNDNEQTGVVLLLEPTPAFYAEKGEKERKRKFILLN